MKSNYKNTVGILGLIISFFGTIFFGLRTIYGSEESFSSSFLICIIGIILVVWWLKHVKRFGIKFGINILLIDQLLILLFPESISHLDGNYGNSMTFFVFIFLVIGIIVSIKGIRKSYKMRQNFSKSIKNQILQKQKHKCAACKKMYPLFHFDHKDGNRSNNALKNCQALCPNCHSIKTLRQIRR